MAQRQGPRRLFLRYGNRIGFLIIVAQFIACLALIAYIQNHECLVVEERTIPLHVTEIVLPQEAEMRLIEDYGTFENQEMKSIPKRIHQIYRSASIPNVYVKYIKSWMEHNPGYEYFLWDDESGRRFISDKYPEFLPLYDAYCHDLFRVDALRYFVLHHYGGIYSDMDYECLKPVDSLLQNHKCALVQEHQPQAQLLYDVDDMVLNAWMAAVPGHPFIKYLINRLPSKAVCEFGRILSSTGPLFVHECRKEYKHILECSRTAECEVHVIPYQLMMPERDLLYAQRYKELCQQWGLTRRQRLGCDEMLKEIPGNLTQEAYASHKFLHLGNQAREYVADTYVHMKDIVPEYKIYGCKS